MRTENTAVGENAPTAALPHECAAQTVDAAVASEAKGPQTETDPLVPPRRKRGRSDGRQPKKQKLRPAVLKRRRRLKLMRVVLDALGERPILWMAARKAGIHRRTLEYMIKRSKAGRDGYEVEYQGVKWGFMNTAKQRSPRPTRGSSMTCATLRCLLSTRPTRLSWGSVIRAPTLTRRTRMETLL